LDSIVPQFTLDDVQLVKPYRRSRRLQILGQLQRKLGGILPRVTDKSGLLLICQDPFS